MFEYFIALFLALEYVAIVTEADSILLILLLLFLRLLRTIWYRELELGLIVLVMLGFQVKLEVVCMLEPFLALGALMSALNHLLLVQSLNLLPDWV